MFAPIEGTLGYTDTYLLQAIPYVPLRELGLPPLVAYQVALMATAALGGLATVLLLRRLFGVRLILATGLGCVSTMSNGLFTQAGHTQLAVIHWLPVIAFLVARGSDRCRRPAALAHFITAGLLAGLVVLSGFYIAWFGMVGLGIGLSTYLLLERSRQRSPFLARGRMLERAVAFAIGLAAPGWAFWATYGPMLTAGRGRTSEDAAAFGMGLRHLVSVGEQNVLWGWLHDAPLGGVLGREWMVGFPAGSLIVVVVSTAWVARHRRLSGPDPISSVGLAAAATMAALVVLPVHIGESSLWNAVARVVPGAVAIRAPGRAWLVAVLAGVVVVGAATALLRSEVPRSRATHARSIATGVLIAVLMIEQLNGDVSQVVGVDHEHRLAVIARNVPDRCRSFYSVGTASDGTSWGVHLDAMSVSAASGLPTLDGYSGFEPDGYPPPPGDPGHPSAMRKWAHDRGLGDGLCELDLGSGRWRLA